MKETAHKGTDLKFMVSIESPGFSMTENEFTVEIRSVRHSQVFTKQELVQDENNKFYVCFNSAVYAPGDIELIATAFVPDLDFDDGIRTEIYKMFLINVQN